MVDPNDWEFTHLAREWKELQKEVGRGLSNGAFIRDPENIAQPEFRIWQFLQLPFGLNECPTYSLDLFSHDGQYRLARSQWMHETDSPCFWSDETRTSHPTPFVPTVDVKFIPVTAMDVEAIISGFRSIRISVGLTDLEDDTGPCQYELFLASNWGRCSLVWVGEQRDELRKLSTQIVRACSYCEKLIEDTRNSHHEKPASEDLAKPKNPRVTPKTTKKRQ